MVVIKILYFFLRGEYSYYILPEYFFSKKLFPKKKIITVSQSNHWVHIDNPIYFYKKVSDFLNEKT
ncbi:hypothetical protein DM812_00085 [Blattabacterium punctulatus]|nr:hypothetical protein DM812_00085 [Blattabacterium punctulatus]